MSVMSFDLRYVSLSVLVRVKVLHTLKIYIYIFFSFWPFQDVVGEGAGGMWTPTWLQLERVYNHWSRWRSDFPSAGSAGKVTIFSQVSLSTPKKQHKTAPQTFRKLKNLWSWSLPSAMISLTKQTHVSYSACTPASGRLLWTVCTMSFSSCSNETQF